MRFAHFFVDRPIFASVLSIVTVIVGAIAFTALPVSEYPEIAPPNIVVRASYPGANAETVAATVATPLEQEINGVEDMLYMSSYSTSDGAMQLTVTFRAGTDLDIAQVLVQNRVAIATPRLPEEVRRLGVTTRKSSPDLMMVVHMLSPDQTHDQLYISNYAQLRVRDTLLRLDGVGDIIIFGAREFSLRVWLDPEKLASYGLAGGDIVRALQEQNVQVSGGALGQEPAPADNLLQLVVTTQGRFEDIRQFRDVIVRATADGRLIRVQDVARVEFGAREYVTNSYLNGKPAVALAIFQRPGTNALQAAADIIARMEQLKRDFPDGIDYQIVYNPTEFIAQSVNEVYITLFEAILLVALVVVVFLQNWRASLIPILAIPVSLVGTFAVMAALGFTLNVLTLFGLVLAIGIVVDDAIVVVENVERNIADGMSPRDAAHETIDEVGTAVVAIAVVLSAVFIPTAFIPGISGQFYRQFALTIATATILSAINSLTLSPALCALLLRRHDAGHAPRLAILRFGRWLSDRFNGGFDRMSRGYGGAVGWVGRRKAFMLVVYAGLAALTVLTFQRVPGGFIPQLDRGYGIVVIQLPEGASLARTDAVVRRASDIALATPGIRNAVAFAGFSGATFTNAPNAAVVFVAFRPFAERVELGLSAGAIIGQLFGRLQAIDEAFIIAIPPPPVPGIGNAGGFKLQVQNRTGDDVGSVMAAAYRIIGQARQTPGLQGVFTTFSASSPQVFLEIDRTKAQMLNVPIANIFETLQVNLGSAYVNDFNAFGRVYQVRVQADQNFRVEREDIQRLKVRSAAGALVPLGTLVNIVDRAGPDLVQRYNTYVSVPVQGNAARGTSSAEALSAMERLAGDLPPGIGFEWTELALQEKLVGNTAVYIFSLAVVFVFLTLAAQYESWILPLSIMLIVPMCVLAALIGVSLRGLDKDILVQIGLVVLIGLAAKNAILIVEFARRIEAEDKTPLAAVVEACRLRLRPILMTALAFILGVLPLVIATGPGAEMRQSLGTAVFAGMLGVTVIGLFFTPVFYVALRALARQRMRRRSNAVLPPVPHPETSD
ncbi:MAG TPA: multidrug efflux RND transporter permease subunit [Alphaproteobacteria bacterium]|nr:multidrug efflux RND transporter permease subunit [Alphaproteobacteria bacterium]